MGFEPDVVTTAKGLGNGVPIGACLSRDRAAELFSAGHHGSTYGGNPLVCAAGLAVVNTIVGEELADNASAMGQVIIDTVLSDPEVARKVTEVRGKGLMLGFQLNRDCGELVQKALEEGLLINVAAGNTIRLLPPLIINETEARELATGVAALIRDFD